jgi:hypothetical protein
VTGHPVRYILVAMICVPFLGCADKPAVDPKVMAETRRDLVQSFKLSSGEPSGAYALCRLDEALRFLDAHPALEIPYCVAANLGGLADESTGGEGYLTVAWLQTKSAALGIVLLVKEDGQERRFRFATLEKTKQEDFGTVTMYAASTADSQHGVEFQSAVRPLSRLLVRYVRVELAAESNLEPVLVAKPPRQTPDLPYVLRISHRLLRNLVAVSVYDEAGAESNSAPVCVEPEIKARIAP